MFKVEIKAFRGNTRLGRGNSCFLLPLTFLFTSLSSSIVGRISKCCRDLGSRLVLWWDGDCESVWGIWLHVIFRTFALGAELEATFLKPALERVAVVVSSLCCPGKLQFQWHKKVPLDCSLFKNRIDNLVFPGETLPPPSVWTPLQNILKLFFSFSVLHWLAWQQWQNTSCSSSSYNLELVAETTSRE